MLDEEHKLFLKRKKNLKMGCKEIKKESKVNNKYNLNMN